MYSIFLVSPAMLSALISSGTFLVLILGGLCGPGHVGHVVQFVAPSGDLFSLYKFEGMLLLRICVCVQRPPSSPSVQALQPLSTRPTFTCHEQWSGPPGPLLESTPWAVTA